VRKRDPLTWIWWAPLVAAALHIFEEFVFPGGFAEWDRMYRPAIRDSITPRLHIIVNAALLALCVQIGLLGASREAAARSIGVVAWIAVAALLGSNAIFHVVGTIRTRTRSPGVITGLLLYLPMAIIGTWFWLRTGAVPPVTAAVAAMIGGSYHAWAGALHRARARARDRRTGPRP